MTTIGAALRQAREGLGISVQSLADMLRVSRMFVYDIERGSRRFPTSRLEDLPPEIREAVSEAMAIEHEATARRLRERNPEPPEEAA